MKLKKQKQPKQANVFDVWTCYTFIDDSQRIVINPYLIEFTHSKNDFIQLLITAVPITQRSKLKTILYRMVLPENYTLPDWIRENDTINILNGIPV